MITITYYLAYSNMKNIYDIRYKMVKYALKHNVSASAKEFATNRRTVRKWRDKYLASGIKGLNDLSRAPKNSPHKLNKTIEIISLKLEKDNPSSVLIVLWKNIISMPVMVLLQESLSMPSLPNKGKENIKHNEI